MPTFGIRATRPRACRWRPWAAPCPAGERGRPAPGGQARRQEVGEQSRYHQQEEEEAQILHQEPVGVERIHYPLEREEGGQNLPRREPVGVERSHPHQEEGEEQIHHLREGEEQIHHHQVVDHQVVEAGTGAAAAVGQEVEVERNHRRQEGVGMP